MSFTLNLAIIMMLSVVGILFLLTKFREKKNDKAVDVDEQNKYEIPTMIKHVKVKINEITNTNLYDLGLSEEEFSRRQRKRAELLSALKSCNTGNTSDKLYVKEFLSDLLIKTYNLNEETINLPIRFNKIQLLTLQDKFDILLHSYKKKYKSEALSQLIEKYHLDELKEVDDEKRYLITLDEINKIFKKEYPKMNLAFEDKLAIIVQRIYSYYKGFGVIDDIRDMNIDGVSGGVSGLPSTNNSIEQELQLFNALQTNQRMVDSVWIMYKGKTIHLSFLSFESSKELKRVVQTIYKHNTPGQLSESKPFIVNEMADGSRVVVVRPSFSESWAFFVRKFDLPKASLDMLITDNRSELAILLIKYLMAGCRVTGVTGSQGSGKTTLLMAMIKWISPTHNLRIQEMAFELNARKLYGNRNILSFQETESITGQQGLDLQKKTDGSVNILGEIATDEVAAWMIQMSQVASLFTVFTHHAKSFEKLVHSLRNSLLKTGVFTNEKIAEEQVVNVINFDIHLRRDSNGHRYIERITECIPLDMTMDYPDDWKQAPNGEEKINAFMETVTEYFKRKTDRKTFEGRNIIEFRNGEYVAVNPISNTQVSEILEHLTDEEGEAFKKFNETYWGHQSCS